MIWYMHDSQSLIILVVKIWFSCKNFKSQFSCAYFYYVFSQYYFPRTPGVGLVYAHGTRSSGTRRSLDTGSGMVGWLAVRRVRLDSPILPNHFSAICPLNLCDSCLEWLISSSPFTPYQDLPLKIARIFLVYLTIRSFKLQSRLIGDDLRGIDPKSLI